MAGRRPTPIAQTRWSSAWTPHGARGSRRGQPVPAGAGVAGAVIALLVLAELHLDGARGPRGPRRGRRRARRAARRRAVAAPPRADGGRPGHPPQGQDGDGRGIVLVGPRHAADRPRQPRRPPSSSAARRPTSAASTLRDSRSRAGGPPDPWTSAAACARPGTASRRASSLAIVRPAGRERHVEWASTPLTVAGCPLLLSIVRDVTPADARQARPGRGARRSSRPSSTPPPARSPCSPATAACCASTRPPPRFAGASPPQAGRPHAVGGRPDRPPTRRPRSPPPCARAATRSARPDLACARGGERVVSWSATATRDAPARSAASSPSAST